jgi:hypothetical protein
LLSTDIKNLPRLVTSSNGQEDSHLALQPVETLAGGAIDLHLKNRSFAEK